MNNEKAIEVINEIKLKDDDQQDDIKHLKEQFYMDGGDEVKEITPMKKNKHVCAICNQTFSKAIWFKKQIQKEHMIPCKPPFPL